MIMSSSKKATSMKKFDVTFDGRSCVGYALYYRVPSMTDKRKRSYRRILLIDISREEKRFVTLNRSIGKILSGKGEKTGSADRYYRKVSDMYPDDFFKKKIIYDDPNSGRSINSSQNLMTTFGLDRLLDLYLEKGTVTKYFRRWFKREYEKILYQEGYLVPVDSVVTDGRKEEQVESSSSTEMVPIYTIEFDAGLTQTCNARELYEYMGSRQGFSKWIKKRLEECLAINGRDFVRMCKKAQANNATLVEYHITLDTAKHIAMLERTEKGRQAREYFIEVEKSWKRGEIKPKVATQDYQSLETVMSVVASLARTVDTSLASQSKSMEVMASAIQTMAAAITKMASLGDVRSESQSSADDQDDYAPSPEEDAELVQAAERWQDQDNLNIGFSRPTLSLVNRNITLRKFMRKNKIRLSEEDRREFAMVATRQARLRNVLSSIPDNNFGKVNLYPIDLLKEIYSDLFGLAKSYPKLLGENTNT
jgi:phage anti-repressor protein